jgi:hypothetical protein
MGNEWGNALGVDTFSWLLNNLFTASTFGSNMYIAEITPEYTQRGKGEFGPLVYDTWCVDITSPKGRRFRHSARFPTAKVEMSDLDGWDVLIRIDDAEGAAQRLADRVNAAIKAGQRLNMDHWTEIDPAYGSEEYIAQGIEAERAFADRGEVF